MPLVGPNAEQMTSLHSPNEDLFSNELGSPLSSTLRLTADEKRSLIDNFLKNEHVFKLLYETVFKSPLEDRQVRESQILQTNSMGQFDLAGTELAPNFVNSVCDENEDLLEAVIQGATSNVEALRRKSSRAKDRKYVSVPKASGTFFTSEPQVPVLAIEAQQTSIERREGPQTFFVTL